jgi:hypothetical protein
LTYQSGSVLKGSLFRLISSGGGDRFAWSEIVGDGSGGVDHLVVSEVVAVPVPGDIDTGQKNLFTIVVKSIWW